MKRFVLFAGLLSSVQLASPAAHATGQARWHPIRLHGVETQVWEGTVSPRAHKMLYAPLSVVNSHVEQVITNSAQLRLPPSTFPAGSRELANFSTTAAEADQNTLFGSILANSNSSFKAQGAIGGWYQRYGRDMPNKGLMVLRYLGTYYPSADAARAVFSALANAYTVNFAETTTCSFGDQCMQGDAQIADDGGLQYAGTYRQVLKGNAIFQGLYDIDQADFSANKASGDLALDTMTTAFLTLLTPPVNLTATATAPPTATPTPSPSHARPPTDAGGYSQAHNRSHQLQHPVGSR